MTLRRWTGVGALLFGILMFAGVALSGTTPDNADGEAVRTYTEYWSDEDNQSGARNGAFVLMYAWVLLACVFAGVRSLLAQRDGGPLPAVVATAGAASAALFGAGAALVGGPGLAGAQTDWEVDGNMALFVEQVGYWVLSTAVMCAAAAVVAATLSNRHAQVWPQWLAVVAGLLALVTLGGAATAWLGFMLLPLWSILLGLVLLLTSDRADSVAVQERAPTVQV